MISRVQNNDQTWLGLSLLSLSLFTFISITPSIAVSQTETYPNRTITMTLPMAAGGTSDLVARLLAPALTEARISHD